MSNRRKRKEFTKAVRIKRWDHCDGRCEVCGVKLCAPRIHFDHDTPTSLGGDNSFENCRVLCVACHGTKTSKQDRPMIDKARRGEEKHLGIRKTKGRPLPGTRASGIRKRMDGTVESW